MAGRRRPPVRSLRRGEVDDAAEVLARAFWDDPVMDLLIPPGSRRRDRRMVHLYRWTILDSMRRDGAVLTTDDLAAVATWHAPGQPEPGPAELVRAAPMGLRAIGPANLPRSLRVLEATQRAHPHEPHWYLQVLGSDPRRRGSGSAAATVERVLERVDEAGVGAYLESSKEENLPYYERFGFVVTEELRPLADGPVLWLMWRDPAPPAT